MPDMPTRRPHTKSRLGCIQCKTRKVKCDQAAPACSNCIRRSQVCSLSAVHSHLASRSIPQKSNKALPSQNTPTPALTSPPASQDGLSTDYSTIDLELIHFYATKTSSMIMTRPKAAALWKDGLFALALEHPRFLDALLATAAMHKLILEPSSPKRDAYTAVILHKGTRLIPYILELLRDPSDDTCVVLLACAILFTYWSFASVRLPPEANLFATPSFAANAPPPLDLGSDPGLVRLDGLLTVLNIGQGTYAVAVDLSSAVQARGFGHLIGVPDFNNFPPTPTHVAIELNSLEDHCKAHLARIDADPAVLEMYQVQFRRLRNIFRVSQTPDWHDLLIGFAVRLPKSVIILLAERDACALTILAFWAAALQALDGAWAIHGWPKAVFEEIREVIDEDWKSHLRVPATFFT